jgi:hypothetical protein
MATKQAYHEFNPSDMPEIRRLRSLFLKGLKLESKSERTTKIAQAIVPDINWAKLSLDVESLHKHPHISTSIDSLDSLFTEFRAQLEEKLYDIIIAASFKLDQEAAESASNMEVYHAALDQATKYHNRNKSGRRRSRKSTNKTKKQIQTPPISSPKVHQSSTSPRSSSPVQRATRPSPPKSNNKTHQATVTRSPPSNPRPTMFSPQTTPLQPILPTIPSTSTSSTFQFTASTTQTSAHRHSNPSSQPSIRNHFRSTKSSKKSKSTSNFKF